MTYEVVTPSVPTHLPNHIGAVSQQITTCPAPRAPLHSFLLDLMLQSRTALPPPFLCQSACRGLHLAGAWRAAVCSSRTDDNAALAVPRGLPPPGLGPAVLLSLLSILCIRSSISQSKSSFLPAQRTMERRWRAGSVHWTGRNAYFAVHVVDTHE